MTQDMKRLVLANQKGGVGKSAVICQYAYWLVATGLRVLFIDLDHQMNSTRAIVKSGRAAVAPITASQVLAGAGVSSPLPEGSFVVVQGDDVLSSLERQPDQHNAYVNALKSFLDSVASRFDVCLIDTNPNPDIRYAAALLTASHVLSPIQLNQEAIDGIGGLLNHRRYGLRKIKATINPDLDLIGLLPNMVEPTPFQRGNFAQIAEAFAQLLIVVDPVAPQYALIPKRSAIAEAQAEGAFVADVKKTAARQTWQELKPLFEVIAKRMGLGV